MIRSISTAFGIYKAMQTLYEQKSASNISLATQQFHSLTWTADMDAMTFVAKLKGLASNLEALGEPPTDAKIIAKVINELPRTFAILKESWEISMIAGNDLTLNDLLSQLVKSESNRKQDEGPGTRNIAYALTDSKGFKGKCFHCDRRGHTKTQCFAPGGPMHDPNHKNSNQKEQRDRPSPSEKEERVTKAKVGY